MMTNAPYAGFRPVIALIGNRNAGKSALLNSLIGQEVSIVSNTLGTTTDAVNKVYELLPAGPVSFYDTAGLDDEGDLGQKRIEATKKVLERANVVLLVIGQVGITPKLEKLMARLQNMGTPVIPVFNFADVKPVDKKLLEEYDAINVSAKTGEGIEQLKNRMIALLMQKEPEKTLLDGLIQPNDTFVLVTPIDMAAPKGRLIMPQVQTLREVVDAKAFALITEETGLATALKKLVNPPKLVITDSQVVKKVVETLPAELPLTTFSMLFARLKGNFAEMLKGAEAIKNLPDKANVLIAEGCSHHISCDDIGRVKIPALLKKYTGKELNFEFVSGNDFPEDVTPYHIVIHCGGCVLTQKTVQNRVNRCQQQHVAITNYGMVISLTQGVLERTSAPLIKNA
jgi:[FeFe] hydrogenase H-cluster maturation GTPase HydF